MAGLALTLAASPGPVAAAPGAWAGNPCRHFRAQRARGRCTAAGHWRTTVAGGTITYRRDGTVQRSFAAPPVPPPIKSNTLPPLPPCPEAQPGIAAAPPANAPATGPATPLCRFVPRIDAPVRIDAAVPAMLPERPRP